VLLLLQAVQLKVTQQQSFVQVARASWPAAQVAADSIE
jgi:hypothetical protein